MRAMARNLPVGDVGSFAEGALYASFKLVDVVLKKIGRKSGRSVAGRLLRPPRKGSVLVIEFPDGLHEYVTTPVKRVLHLCGEKTYYIETANSRYRLEVSSEQPDRESEQRLSHPTLE